MEAYSTLAHPALPSRRLSPTHLDALQHGRAQDVHACVDLIGHKYLRLLDKSVNSACVSLTHHHAILGRLFHLGYLNTEVEGTLGLVQCFLP